MLYKSLVGMMSINMTGGPDPSLAVLNVWFWTNKNERDIQAFLQYVV